MHTTSYIDADPSLHDSMDAAIETNDKDLMPLHVHVELAVQRYFDALGDEDASNLYNLFLAEFEKPLLMATLQHTRGNQSKTAQILGLNRGTLRTKLKSYGLL